MREKEIKNAVISSWRFDMERGLTFWIDLDYGGSGQGFGGYLLYAPKGWRAHGEPGNFAGHYLWRVMEIAGVGDLSELRGKTIRARIEDGLVAAIGHIVNDDWFCPRDEFAAMQAQFAQQDATA